ncbi:MAG: ATP-grasp domain-containing protein [Candidatus Rokubacteria bacterium]|nr:ATP-grasp domain-containing protein [Candidatus Rokubacteria bacterium]
MPKLRIGIAQGPKEAPATAEPGRRARRKTEVEEIAGVLGRAGHETFPIVVDGSPECLKHLAQVQADLVFNLVEGFGDDDTKEPHVAAYYELLGLRYTGSGPLGLSIAMDKGLTKRILAFHGVQTPMFAVVFRGRLEWAHDIDFPVIVKPSHEDGSIGIGFRALAHSIKELMERIDELHADFNQPVLIEQYIEGREIYVGVLGNSKPEAFPLVELDLSHLPKGTPRIAGTEVKWEEGTRAYRGSKIRVPDDLPPKVVEAIREIAVTSFQALHLRDYARFDFRVTPGHKIYLIEANPNPYLHSGAEFIKGARASGRTHPKTVLEIVELAQARYGVQG